MKRLLYFLGELLLPLAIGWFILEKKLNAGSLELDSSVWESYIGRDTTIGILPDQHANYFTYTLARTDNDMAFRIKGKFSDTRNKRNY